MQQGFSGLFIYRKIARKMREINPKTFKFGKWRKEKSLENVVFSRLFCGGGSGNRTHVPVGKRFSRPPRYDHFDIPPYYDATYAFFAFENLFSNHNGYFTTNLFACQVFLSKITHFILFIFTYFLRAELFSFNPFYLNIFKYP